MLLASMLLAWSLQEPGAAAPPSAEPAATASLLSPLHGTVAMRYRYRFTSDDRDSDLYELVTLRYGDAAQDAVTASLTARFAEDIDGDRRHEGFQVFDSRDDTYRHATTARLYTAYVDLHRPLPGLFVRGGRQILDEFPEAVPIDGALARQQVADGVIVGAFGGLPVNLYESSPSGDSTYGGWAEALAGSRTRARLEYLHLRDENAFGLFKDDLLGASLEHGFGTFLAHARYTLLEGESRDATARLTGAFDDLGLVVYGQFAWQFKTQQAHAYAIDPFAVFLMELAPYIQTSLGLSKSLGPRLSVDASAVFRELTDDGDEAAYNHEFRRLGLTLHGSDVPTAGVSVAASIDYWNSSADDFWAAGGDVTYAASRAIRAGLGTSFALYAIDAATGEERERVRSIYASFRWKFTRDTTLDLRASIDRDAHDTYTTLDVAVRRAF